MEVEDAVHAIEHRLALVGREDRAVAPREDVLAEIL